jgi:hypothetical protein
MKIEIKTTSQKEAHMGDGIDIISRSIIKRKQRSGPDRVIFLYL